MTVPKLRGTLAFSTLAAAAVLAPVRFSTAEALTPVEAECTTCCTKASALCVVCGKTCVTVTNAYDKGTGACPP